MNKIVFIERPMPNKQFWTIISWCNTELGYKPRTQTSDVCSAFKFDTQEDAMAFKLRWYE